MSDRRSSIVGRRTLILSLLFGALTVLVGVAITQSNRSSKAVARQPASTAPLSAAEELGIDVPLEDVPDEYREFRQRLQSPLPFSLPEDTPWSPCGGRGYFGPLCDRNPRGDAPGIVEGSVWTVRSSRGLTVYGVARNETNRPMNDVVVRIGIGHRDGSRITEERRLSIVEPLLPGEPAPFAVELSVNGPREVKDVGVQVVDFVLVEESLGRDALSIEYHWSEPYGYREPVETYLYADKGDPPYPYLLTGTLRNVADKHVRGISMKTWALRTDVQPAGKVGGSSVYWEDGADSPPRLLEAGDFADFLVVVGEPGDARLLDRRLTLMLWATSQGAG